MGRHVLTVRADLARTRDCEELVRIAFKECGTLDAFVHCASEFTATPLGRVTRKVWDAQMQLNCASAFFLSQEIGMRMKKGRGGAIVHFSDVTATRPYADHIPYGMAKAAIEAMVKGMAVGFAPKVRINAIAPYLVAAPKDVRPSDRARIKKMPMHRATEPREVARIVRLLTEPDSTITGEVVTVDGGRRLVW